MVPAFLAKLVIKFITAKILKKLVGKIVIIVLRKYAKSTENTLDDEIVDTIEAVIIKGK